MELQHFDSEEDSSIDFDHSDEENDHNNNHKVNHNYTDNNDHTDDELEDITTLLFHQSMGLEMEPMLPQPQQQLPSSSTTTRQTGNDFLSSSTSERIIGTTTTTNTTSSRRGIQQSSNSSGPIRTTSGTLLYARNTNSTTNNTTTTGNNNNSNNNNNHYRTSLSFNSTGSRSNGSLTSSMSPQQRSLQRSPISPSPSSLTSLLPLQQLLPQLSSSSSSLSPFKETINPNNTSTTTTYSTNNNTRPWKFWESSKIMNRYRSTAPTTTATATTTSSYNNHRIQRTASTSFHNSQIIRSTPRINTFLKILIIMILFCIVINYWERVSWTTYLVVSNVDSSMTTTRSIDETEQYHMKNHVETYPPTISPTIPTIIDTTQNDDENNDDDDGTTDHNQNDEHENDHPSSNIQQSSLDSKKNSVLLWFQLSSIGMKKSSKTSKTNNNNGNEFVEKWCDMRGTTWYPDDNTQTTTHSKHQSSSSTTTTIYNNTTIPWQLRAPYFLLPGASYSGTVYIASILHSHPQILPTRTKELQFFYDKPFRKYIHPLTDKTLVHAARQRMYARDYNIQLLQQPPSSQHSESMQYISFDATPGYLYYSTILPRRILCVEPWIKIVLLLRNPIDRILEQFYAQYSGSSSGSSSSSMNHKIPKHLSLDSCIQHELHLMEEVGLLNITDNNSKFYGSKEEDIAWYKYQSLSRIDGLIGRSMYVIQLRHWIAAFRMAGRVPSESILIVYSENFVLQPQYEYDRMVQFINIEPNTISTSLLDQMPQSLSHPTRYVSDETRQVLEDFFVPYNKQLQRLLYRYDISSTSD